MCLAIAPNSKCSNNLFSRLWSHVAATPLKLLTFGAIVHLLIGTGIVIYSSSTGADINTNILLNGLTYGVVPLLVFGFLLSWLPRRFSLSPVHYGRYNSIYLFTMLSLLSLEFASIINNHWTLTGMLLLIPGWLIALQGLWEMHTWIKSNVQKISMLLLTLLTLVLATLIITILEHYVGTMPPHVTPVIILSLLWPPVFILSILLILKAPANSRIISL